MEEDVILATWLQEGLYEKLHCEQVHTWVRNIIISMIPSKFWQKEHNPNLIWDNKLNSCETYLIDKNISSVGVYRHNRLAFEPLIPGEE